MNICPTPKCYLPRPWVYQEKGNLVSILAKKKKEKNKNQHNLCRKKPSPLGLLHLTLQQAKSYVSLT